MKKSKLTRLQTLQPVHHHHHSTNTNTAQAISNTDSLLDSYSSSSTSHSATTSHTAVSPVWHCAWSTDGTILATCHGRPDACIRLYKKKKYQQPYDKDTDDSALPSWNLIATLRGEEDETMTTNTNTKSRTIRSIAFAPTPPNVRAILAAASFDGSISIWEDFSSESYGKQEGASHHLDHHHHHREEEDDTRKKQERERKIGDTPCGWECTAQLEGHESEVKDVTWNATGTLLASCSRDKTVWIWECFLPGTIGGDGNGSTGPSGGEGDFECLAVLQGHTADVKCIKFAPSHEQFGDGDEILLSASYDDTIRCWAEDAGEWYCALTLEGVHMNTIWSIAISPSGVRMVSGSADKSLAIWKCYTAFEKKELENAEGSDTVAAYNKVLSDGLWKCVGKLPNAHSQPIYSVDCAPSKAGHGRIISGGGDDCIHVYREVGGTSDAPLFSLDVSVQKAHDGDVNCVKWHPTDGRLFASAGDDGLVKIWRYDIS